MSSIVIGLKNSFFSTNSLAKLLSDSSINQSRSKLKFKSTNHIQSCSLNQPISISEQHETIYASFVSLLMQIFPFFYNLAVLLFSEIVIFMIKYYLLTESEVIAGKSQTESLMY